MRPKEVRKRDTSMMSEPANKCSICGADRRPDYWENSYNRVYALWEAQRKTIEESGLLIARMEARVIEVQDTARDHLLNQGQNHADEKRLLRERIAEEDREIAELRKEKDELGTKLNGLINQCAMKGACYQVLVSRHGKDNSDGG